MVHLVTASDGQVVGQCQPLKKFLPKLARLERRMSGKKKFSRNWQKARARVGKLHSKIANIRKHFLHQVSRDISKNHAIVFVEDLEVQSMSRSARKKVAQKSGLNRSILDASPYALRSQLQYKTAWEGGLLVAEPPQNTSRKYPRCGHTAAENRETQAQFLCRKCGFSANADWVAAWNIKEAGLALLAWRPSSSAISSSCQEPTEATQVQRCA